MLDWIKCKLESRLPGEKSVTSDVQMTPPLYKAESKEKLKSPLMKVKEESENAGLKFSIQKMKIMASRHIMANRWGNSGNNERLYFGGLQNHCRW